MDFSKPLVKFLVWRLKYINDTNFTLIIAGFVGLIAGIAAVTLKTTVHLIQNVLQASLELTGVYYLWLIYPLIGIILTVIVAKYIINENMGHGISKVLYAISKRSSVIKKTRMYSRMVTSAITVGFGGSVGLEAPIVVTGSAIGSNLARLVHLDYKKRTLLIGCGSAGAVSAIFNSPIAGVIFAVEVILTDVTINKFIPILIASVMGQLVTIILLGEDILFAFRLDDSFHAGDTPYYLLLGVVCGGTSLYFTRMMNRVELEIKKVNNTMLRAILGGVGLGLIVLIFPPIYGEGYNTVTKLLEGAPTALYQGHFFDLTAEENSLIIPLIIFLIIVVKPAATALTIGSGGSGGIFGPSLFMGGLTGFLLGYLINMFFPESGVNLTHFTLVGMCGLMSGVLHAPLTAIFLIAEITSGYILFVPLMLVSAISFNTIHYFEKHSIYTKNLIARGDIIMNDKDKMVLSLINLNKIIEKDLLMIEPTASLGELVKLVKRSKRNIFPVVNEKDELEGIITLDNIREIMFEEENRENIIVNTIMRPIPASVSTNEKMQSVMNKFQITQAWNLPVIDDGKYVGFVSKSRIFSAYRTQLIKQSKE